MAEYFDRTKWDTLVQEPDWYAGELWDEYEQLRHRAETADDQTAASIKRAVRGYFADRLAEGAVALAAAGDDLDQERKPIDSIVIHHTSAEAGTYDLPYLNAVHMLQIYAPYFREPTVRGEEHLKGTALWSGHFYEGRQVFWAYHWFVKQNGEPVPLLDDDAIGWHAGNWDINCRSVGICLDGDFTDKTPPTAMLQTVRRIIEDQYDFVTESNIMGHHDARASTECPGKNYEQWLPLLRG